MRILLINWMDMENPAAGGAEVHLMELFRRFVLRGDDVSMVCSGFKDGSPEAEYEGIKIYRTGTRETFNFKAPGLIKELEKKNKFDIIVEDINKVPVFTPLFTKTPVLVIIPHLFGSAVFRETSFIPASYVYLMEKPIPAVYKNCIFEAISDSTAKDLIKRGISPDKIRIVNCGMDHELYYYDNSVEKCTEPTILYLGRIKKYKSVDVIIKAMPKILKKISAARLIVVGSGDYQKALENIADILGISRNVVFTGFVSSAEKVSWMRRSHVIVNPSPKEGWGLTNIEANACGTPVIASDADGLRDSVCDGETGYLFPYGNTDLLAEKVIKVLDNESLRKNLSENSIKWAKTFTWERAALQTMEIVDEIVKNN